MTVYVRVHMYAHAYSILYAILSFCILYLLDFPVAVDSSTIEVTSKLITSVAVQWTAVKDDYYPIHYYYLRLSTCDDSSSLRSCQPLNTFKSADNTTAYTLENLAPFTVYSLELAAENSVGIGPYSDPVMVQCKSDSHTTWNYKLPASHCILSFYCNQRLCANGSSNMHNPISHMHAYLYVYMVYDTAHSIPVFIYITLYCILSKDSSQVVARKIRHLVTLRIGMNKMAEGDEYLDYLDETLERAAKPWSALLGAFLKTKWQVLNSETSTLGR